jgi:hypothetical protein
MYKFFPFLFVLIQVITVIIITQYLISYKEAMLCKVAASSRNLCLFVQFWPCLFTWEFCSIQITYTGGNSMKFGVRVRHICKVLLFFSS